ncbi:unannotated protein [freshwater metagenome]|uniref:Unannotated protein n=1 Tax=freshwater metagenome TaxID=449393 RepID=A0A6J6GQE6_9ZZZZ
MRRILPTVTLCLIVGSGLAACGSSSSSSSSSTSTARETATSATAAPSDATSTTTIETPPPNPNEPIGPPSDACELLGQRLLPTDLRPADSSSWLNERQRVLIDAKLTVDLLGAVLAAPPEQIRGSLVAERTYAEFVGRTMETATGYPDAIAKLDGYPDRTAVASAEAEISAWSTANC